MSFFSYSKLIGAEKIIYAAYAKKRVIMQHILLLRLLKWTACLATIDLILQTEYVRHPISIM